MRWVCPHCKTTLETPGLAKSAADVPGPQDGWAYARCFQCDEFAMVELATAKTTAIMRNHKISAAPQPAPSAPKAIATPPPFNPASLGKDVVVTDAAPPLPRPETVAAATATPVFAPIEWSPPFPTEVRSRMPAMASYLAATAGAVALAIGVASYWAARTPLPAKIAVKSPTPPATSPLERAHAVAQRIAAQTPPIAPSKPAPPVSAQTTARLAANGEMSDAIHSMAMAPTRPNPDQVQLYLQARKSVRTMELRTGPGSEFQLFGLADLDERYPVVEWKNRWFRIQLEETPGLTAWVPYERVELFSKDQVEAELREEVKGRHL